MLEAMNTYRLKEKAVLTDSTYFSIGVVLKDYLNYILKENDYISAKMLMSLATALHKNNPQPHQPRIFMQTDRAMLPEAPGEGPPCLFQFLGALALWPYHSSPPPP